MCRHYGNTGSGTTRSERRRTVVSVGERAKKAPANAPEWIVVDFDSRGFRCERCGATQKHSTPRGISRLESFSLLGQAFSIDHSDCTTRAPNA